MYKPAKEIGVYPDILFQIFGRYSDFRRYLGVLAFQKGIIRGSILRSVMATDGGLAKIKVAT